MNATNHETSGNVIECDADHCFSLAILSLKESDGSVVIKVSTATNGVTVLSFLW